MKKLFAIITVFCLLLGGVAVAEAAPELNSEFLWYVHDPRENPSAMADIVEDPTAIYGFKPSAGGSLAVYAEADWSDPEVVEAGRQDRLAYHESIEDMYVMFNEMKAEGKTTEEIARAVSARRNEIRLESYADDPDGLAAVKARNLEKYGHEEGPLADELYEKSGSWQKVLESAFSTNSGMDACLGLYDDYYELYVASGQVEANTEPSEADRDIHKELLAANGWESVIARHDSKKCVDAYYQDGRALLEFSRRMDADSDYNWAADFEKLATRDFYIEADDEGSFYQELKRPEDYAVALETARIEEISLDNDALLSVQERNGAWYVITENEDREFLERRVELANEYWELDEELVYQDGMKNRHYIVYDGETMDQLLCWSVLCFPDGHQSILQWEAYDYNSQDNFEAGLLSLWFGDGESRTITLVFDADTEQPEPVTYGVPVGATFDISIGGQYPAVYTDEELTTEMDYKATLEMGDATLYIRADGT